MLANPNNVNIAYRNMICQYIIYLRLLINQKSSGSIFIFIFLLMFSLEIQHILHTWSSVYEQFGSGASEAQPYREWSMKMFPREPTHTSIPPLCNACTHAHQLDFEGSLITTEKLTDQWQIRGATVQMLTGAHLLLKMYLFWSIFITDYISFVC